MLYIFDVDGTLVDSWTTNLLPGVREWFDANKSRSISCCFATNQGGVGLRHWMESGGFGEPDKLPTEGEVILRLSRIADALNYPLNMYYCFAYKSKSSDEWGPAKSGEREWSHSWRKPGPGMLLQAMKDAGASPDETVFIGDSEEDRLAAEAAGVKFVHADVFFNAA